MKYSSVALALLHAMASPASGSISDLANINRVLEAAPTCTHSARKIKIQSTTGEPLSFREVRVFSGDVNVAIGKTATQSSDLNEDSDASKAVDRKWSTMANTGDDCSTWWEVDLEESTPINKVQIVNPKCADDSSCSCKLSHAVISLVDADGETVSAKVVGDTCDKGWVSRKFEVDCPSAASPTNDPTAAPVSQNFLAGDCLDASGKYYPFLGDKETGYTVESCQAACPVTNDFVGISYKVSQPNQCYCLYNYGSLPPAPEGFMAVPEYDTGTGPIASGDGSTGWSCHKYHPEP